MVSFVPCLLKSDTLSPPVHVLALLPCDHVLQMQSAGDNSWLVQCNSGTYQVSRDENWQLTFVKANWPEG